MLEIFDINYTSLSDKKSEELFTLRKETFKDRLNWAVNCIDGMEFDEYDNHNTNYLFGVKDNIVICSLRFIEMQYPNMITGTFSPYFGRFTLPEGNYIESSRFFIDKIRARKVGCSQYPISTLFFLAMVNYARKFNYDGILTIVSHPMLTILERSGWGVSVIEQGISEKNEKVYLLHLPVDTKNQNALIERVQHAVNIEKSRLASWPLVCSLMTEKLA
ncbi:MULTISPECIES: acyl-homoserine-lactone synthase [unclassified Serratia (in: enterobacteria)]|uniref:acyl-homoserine-lactone synthase n=1 Tax=unclassified Serratia (in: enterobacteria) TaxID=2647522 RepID=UPI0030761CFD